MTLDQRYKDFSRLDSDAIGPRHRARHAVIGRPVIVRQIESSLRDDQQARIAEAAVRMAALVHPNIVAVIDADFGDQGYFVYDDPGGPPLATRIAEDDGIGRADSVRWSVQLLSAIQTAHAADVLHRGLSPSRMFVDRANNLQVTDFGMVAAVVATTDGVIALDAESSAFLPVRVLRDPSRYDAAADRYGAGAIVFRLLTGIAPEPGETSLKDEAPDVPEALASAFGRLLRSQNDASDLHDTLEALRTWQQALGTTAGVVQAGTSAEELAVEQMTPAAVDSAAMDSTAVEAAAAQQAADSDADDLDGDDDRRSPGASAADDSIPAIDESEDAFADRREHRHTIHGKPQTVDSAPMPVGLNDSDIEDQLGAIGGSAMVAETTNQSHDDNGLASEASDLASEQASNSATGDDAGAEHSAAARVDQKANDQPTTEAPTDDDEAADSAPTTTASSRVLDKLNKYESLFRS